MSHTVDDPQCLTVVPELPVVDLPKALDWFRDVLGFGTAWVWKEDFAAVFSGEVQIYLRKVADAVPVARCYLHVRDADSLHDRCRRTSAVIVDELESKPWGCREFAVESPGGNIIRIGHAERRVDEISQFVTGIEENS